MNDKLSDERYDHLLTFLERLESKFDKMDDKINGKLDKQNGRVRKLEINQGYIAGVGGAVVLVIPILIKVIFG